MQIGMILALILVAIIVLYFVSRPRSSSVPKLVQGYILIGPGKTRTMSFNVRSGQSGRATAVFTDAKGIVHPLAKGNIPQWTVEPAGAVAITPDADGMGTQFVGGDTPQDFTLKCTAEGDPTPGQDTIVASIAGTVVAAEDTQGTISVALDA